MREWKRSILLGMTDLLHEGKTETGVKINAGMEMQHPTWNDLL